MAEASPTTTAREGDDNGVASRPQLDIDAVRSHFPAFSHPDTAGWAHLENAGGSYVPRQVIEILEHFYTATKVQPYWDFAPSTAAGEAMDVAKARMPATFNAAPTNVHFGPSTTQNVYVLAAALRPAMSSDAEVIVTNQDHEANIGAWRRLADTGVTVHEWGVDHDGLLDVADLESLVTERTSLVAVTHASNVAATHNPIREIADLVHQHGALLAVDGVSYAPHAAVDVQALACDIYLYSAYKTFGPHVGMMYVADQVANEAANQGHYFNEGTATGRLVPAGPNHAQIAGCAGILAYYDDIHRHHYHHFPADDTALVRDVFDLFAAHEAALMAPLGDFLGDRDGVRLVGTSSTSHDHRAPTFAFSSERSSSADIYRALIDAQVACGHGHFYAHRLMAALGLDPADGVVRLSLAHYNTAEEVARALDVIDGMV